MILKVINNTLLEGSIAKMPRLCVLLLLNVCSPLIVFLESRFKGAWSRA